MSSAAPRPRALIFSFGGIVDAAGGDADGGRGAPPCGAGPALSHAGGGVKTMVKTIYFLKNNSKIVMGAYPYLMDPVRGSGRTRAMY